MPFINTVIYDESDNDSDGVFNSVENLKVEYMDVDLTFFNNVIIEYSDIMDYASTYVSSVYNPFFVKDDILYCAGWFGPKDDTTDKKLRWHKYSLRDHTYSEQIIDGSGIKYSKTHGNDKYMAVPVRRLNGLKFYCIVVEADEYNGNSYFCTDLCIIDYENNTYTTVTPDTYVGGKSGMAFVGVSGYMYLCDQNRSKYYIDTNVENPSKTYVYNAMNFANPIFSRIASNGSDEIVDIGLNSYSSSVEVSMYTSVCRALESSYIIKPSTKISATSSDILGSDYYHFKQEAFGAYRVELNYKNIHCIWVSGSYGRSVQLIVTGNTDLVNEIQPFRLVGEIGYAEYTTENAETRRYVVRSNSINQSSVNYSSRPPYIPDLDKHVMYGIPAVTYKTTKEKAIMMRVSSKFLDELDTKGGEVW